MTLVWNWSWNDVRRHAFRASSEVWDNVYRKDTIALFGVPRGGVYAALAVQEQLTQKGIPSYMTDDPDEASVIIDDLIDSGKTHVQYQTSHPKIPFIALIDKRESKQQQWITFPWERANPEGESEGIEDNVRRILQFIGEDPKRNGLIDTPARVAKSYKEIFAGYNQNPADIMKVFDEGYDEMVLLKNAEFYSVCEHHMQPFFGKAHIAYIPADGRVIGVSKLARLLDIFARRLQIQERICSQVTSALMEFLKPGGAACVLEAKHFCMVCRGVQKQHSSMVTSSLEGFFRDNQATRAEFFNLIK